MVQIELQNHISVVTSGGELDAIQIFDSIGQGRFGAALASSLNIGCAIYDATLGMTDLKLNSTLEQARTGAELIGETLAKQRLKSNYGKTKYVILGSEEFKERTRQEAAVNPVKMGSHIIEESKEEKYLGDQIHTDGLEASIPSTINK